MNDPTVGANQSVEPGTRMRPGRPRLRQPPRDKDKFVARPRAPARFTLASGASPPRRGANEVVRAPATDRVAWSASHQEPAGREGPRRAGKRVARRGGRAPAEPGNGGAGGGEGPGRAGERGGWAGPGRGAGPRKGRGV